MSDLLRLIEEEKWWWQPGNSDWDPIYFDLVFDDETFGKAPPMPRWVAELLTIDFALGTPWLNGRRVVMATPIPWVGPLN